MCVCVCVVIKNVKEINKKSSLWVICVYLSLNMEDTFVMISGSC